jgi:hypothetical protein
MQQASSFKAASCSGNDEQSNMCVFVGPPAVAVVGATAEFKYTAGDWLLFGAETTGLPLQGMRCTPASLVWPNVTHSSPIIPPYVLLLHGRQTWLVRARSRGVLPACRDREGRVTIGNFA